MRELYYWKQDFLIGSAEFMKQYYYNLSVKFVFSHCGNIKDPFYGSLCIYYNLFF